jgi:hypothetical protein
VHVGAQLDGITQIIGVHDNVIKTLTNPGVSQLAGVFVDAGTTAGLLSNFCDVNITGNHIVGVGYGTNALNSSVAGVLIPGNFYTNSCVVKDNLISFIQSGTGGSTFGVLASTTPTAAGNSILTIADNTITDIGQVGFPPVAAYGVVCLKLLSSDPIVNTTIRGNTIKRLIASSGSCTPIWILGSALLKNTQVCDNSIEGIYASAPNTAGLILIQASSVYDLVVQGNTLTTGGLSFQRSAFSIDVQMLTSTGFASGITITKNRVIDFGGIHVSGVYLSPNISAVNNIIINDNNLLLGDTNGLSGIQVDNCAVSGLTISANTIADFAGLARFGVAIYGVSNTVRAKNVAISNNTVISTDSTKGDFAGIYLYYTTGFTITGNMVNWGAEGNNDSRAILLVGVKQGSVSGNLCVPTGLRTATIELTLTFPTECEYVLVSGNVVNSATWTAGTIAGIDANVHHTYGSTSSGADVRDYLNLGA